MNKPEIYFDENSTNKIKLKDIAVLKNGYSFNSKQYTKSGKYNIITISNVQGKRFTVINDGTNKISILPSNLMSYQVLKDFDILVSMTGNVGRVSYNKGQNNLLNQRVGLIEIISKKIIREYLYQILSCYAFEKEMQINSQGAAQLNISKLDIESYQFYLPSLEEQEKIAALLSNFDSKIEQEVKIIEKLKIIKKSLLDKMFPREGSYVPDLRFSGYENSWEQRKLLELGYATGGTSIESEFSDDGIYKVISIGSYSEDSIYKDQGLRAINSEKTQNRVLNKDDITMILNDKTASGNIIGRVLLIEESGIYVYNQRTERIELDIYNYDPQFVYTMLNAPKIRKKIINQSQGNTQIYVNWSNIAETNYLIPTLEEQRVIGNYFEKIASLFVLHQRKCKYFL